MAKRKADTEIECESLVKSLRRSISDFLAKSDAVNVDNAMTSRTGTILNDEKSWEMYRRRLATFDEVASRTAKPKEISPVVCARHGWKNIGDDFLQCDDCGKVLCIKLPGEEVSNRVFNHCVWHIQRKLIEAHTVICPWRTSIGLDVSACYDIAARYKQLVESGQPELPLAEHVMDEELLQKFGFDNRFFLLLAIFGWLPPSKSVAFSDDNTANFVCHLCGRKLYESVFSAKNPLDPQEQHHFYCPIIDPVFPLWRESMHSVHKLKKKEPLIPALWSVKSMLKRLFGAVENKGEKEVVTEKHQGDGIINGKDVGGKQKPENHSDKGDEEADANGKQQNGDEAAVASLLGEEGISEKEAESST